jgi:hypothetical protein
MLNPSTHGWRRRARGTGSATQQPKLPASGDTSIKVTSSGALTVNSFQVTNGYQLVDQDFLLVHRRRSLSDHVIGFFDGGQETISSVTTSFTTRYGLSRKPYWLARA